MNWGREDEAGGRGRRQVRTVQLTCRPGFDKTIAYCPNLAHCLFLSRKFYLKPVIPTCLHMAYGCFGATKAEMKSSKRLCSLQNPKYLYPGLSNTCANLSRP